MTNRVISGCVTQPRLFFFVKFPEFEPTECKCEGSTFDGNKFDLTVIQMEWCKLGMVYI